MHTRVDSAMDVQVLNTIMMEAKIISAAHTQEATVLFYLNFKTLLGHHASEVQSSRKLKTAYYNKKLCSICGIIRIIFVLS